MTWNHGGKLLIRRELRLHSHVIPLHQVVHLQHPSAGLGMLVKVVLQLKGKTVGPTRLFLYIIHIQLCIHHGTWCTIRR